MAGSRQETAEEERVRKERTDGGKGSEHESRRNRDGKESPCHGEAGDTTKQRIRYRKNKKNTLLSCSLSQSLNVTVCVYETTQRVAHHEVVRYSISRLWCQGEEGISKRIGSRVWYNKGAQNDGCRPQAQLRQASIGNSSVN